MSALLPCSAHLLHLYYSAVLQARLQFRRAHLLRYRAMTEELITCELTCSADPGDWTVKTGDMDCERPIFSVSGGVVKQQEPPQEQQQAGDTAAAAAAAPTSPAAAATTAGSGISPAGCELCVEHESELDWFCRTERKPICSHCAVVGTCRGHTVTPLANRVTAIRVSVWSLNTEAVTFIPQLFAFCCEHCGLRLLVYTFRNVVLFTWDTCRVINSPGRLLSL